MCTLFLISVPSVVHCYSVSHVQANGCHWCEDGGEGLRQGRAERTERGGGAGLTGYYRHPESRTDG